jgi:nitrogen PTS system EIIA component
MRILDFLRQDGIICPLEAGSKEEVLKELVQPIVKDNPQVDKTRLLKTLMERENLGSTGIGGGIAIPHGKMEGLDQLVGSFGKSQKGINFHSMDDRPAYIFFLLVAPKNCAADHLKALARISRLLKDPQLVTQIQKADTADQIYRILEDFDIRCP